MSTIMEHGRTTLLVERGLRIEIDPLIPLSADRRSWAESQIARDVPADAKLELIGQVDDETRTHTPMTLITARVRDSQGQVREVRHVAFYVFGDRGGLVMCRLLTREASARFSSSELEELLRSAHVDPTVEPARLDDLYE